MYLLAEDSPEDAFFIERALKKAGFNGSLKHVNDGQEAIDYLNGINGFSDRGKFPLPDVVLTDLKMPRVSGFELMSWIRGQTGLTSLPIAVLTSSHLEQDKAVAARYGACAYLVKDMLLTDNGELVSTLKKCVEASPAVDK